MKTILHFNPERLDSEEATFFFSILSQLQIKLLLLKINQVSVLLTQYYATVWRQPLFLYMVRGKWEMFAAV